MSEKPGQDDGLEATRTSFDGAVVAPSVPVDLPASIGHYRILGVLGRGGMGIVYEAEQQTPRRTVALKVVRGGMFVDDETLRLFKREADSLARLKHPGIAAVYETGRTEDGQHFFAMELVRGKTLDVSIGPGPARDRATLETRLRLFRELCAAVSYAHQRGVIHRDLKPSNVIVTEEEGKPAVKVLDFGLARITDTDVAAATMMTEVGMIRGTLPYMSPEQVRGDPHAIDLRTDVYSLGVVLYEMLAGARPYETGNTSLIDSARIICEQPPRSLRESSRAGTMRFDTDLETIVAKALEKEPDRRYPSAAALGDDLARYLASQPILARPPSAIYQLRKLVARNRAPAVLLGLLLVSVVAFGVGMAVLYARAQRERAEAVRQARIAQAVNDFLNDDLLAAADPDRNAKRDVTVKEVLEEAAKRVKGRFPDEPLVAAAVHHTLGSTFGKLGMLEKAEPELREALAARTRELGPEAPLTLRTAAALGNEIYNAARYPEAEALLRKTAQSQSATLGREHPDTLQTLALLGNVLYDQRNLPEAEQVARGVLEAAARSRAEESEPACTALNTLGMVTQDTERYDEAIQILTRLSGIMEKRFGPDAPATLNARNSLGQAYSEKGDIGPAAAISEDILVRARRVLGNDHSMTQAFVNNLAIAYRKQGKHDLAEALYREGWETSKRILGEDAPPTLISAVNLSRFYVVTDRCADHLPFVDRTAELHRRALGLEHPYTGLALLSQGECRMLLGRHAEAVPILTQAVETIRGNFPDDDVRVRKAQESLVRARAGVR